MGGLAESLAVIKDWTFKLGPGCVVGIGNELILSLGMYPLIWGFKSSLILVEEGRPVLHPALEAR